MNFKTRLAALFAALATVLLVFTASPAQAVLAPNGTINAGVSTGSYSNVLVSFQSNLDGFVWQGYIPQGHRWGEGTNSSYNSEPQRVWANPNHVVQFKVNSGPWNCLPGGTQGASWSIHPGSGYSGTWAVTLILQKSSGGICY